jgi:predicted anti-sigma-YlaC factor YlaD
MITDERSCVRARMELSSQLDGEPSDDLHLRTHLAGCAECREHERSLASLSRAFDALRRLDAHADLWPWIEREIAALPDDPTSWWRRAGRRPGS